MAALWKQASFRWYYFGLLLSGLGDQFGWMGLTWYMMNKTGSSVAMGSVIFAYTVPGLISGLLAGVLLDRFDRRKLMIADNVLRGLLFLLLVLFLASDRVWIGWVYLTVVCAGMLSPISTHGASVLLPQFVADKSLLTRANSLMEAQWQIVYLGGPALAGVLIAWVGESAVLLIDGCSFFICAFCFWKLRLQPVEKDVKEMTEEKKGGSKLGLLLEDLKTGYVYMGTNRMLLVLIFVTLFFNMAYGPIEVALPLFANQSAGGSASLGLLWSAFAAGSLAGTLVFSLINWRFSLGATLSGIIVLWGITTLPLAFAPSLWIAVAVMAVAGFCYAPYGALYRTFLQRSVPNHLLGRVFTSIRTVTGVGMPLGAAVSGFLIPVTEVSGLFGLSAVACLIVGAISFRALR
ncbi:MFS transporter [Brevibacillus fluminis]|uniref:MFS transporter n=1 Tax=Brevibacillus fluminis TaxID=511487 RepID=UPI003F8A37B7